MAIHVKPANHVEIMCNRTHEVDNSAQALTLVSAALAEGRAHSIEVRDDRGGTGSIFVHVRYPGGGA